MNYISQSVSELSVKPAKAVTSWLTDQIAPGYWKPNSLILVSDEAISSLWERQMARGWVNQTRTRAGCFCVHSSTEEGMKGNTHGCVVYMVLFFHVG